LVILKTNEHCCVDKSAPRSVQMSGTMRVD
jgi:hypothetical protein